jgi:Mg2+-importing ATPase
LAATLLIAVATLCFPYTPFAGPFGFKPLPASVILIIIAIIGIYVITAEIIKRIFYKRVKF